MKLTPVRSEYQSSVWVQRPFRDWLGWQVPQHWFGPWHTHYRAPRHMQMLMALTRGLW